MPDSVARVARRWPCLVGANVLLLCGPGGLAVGMAEGNAATPYAWASAPVEVQGLPPGAGPVPVSLPVDFSELLERVRIPGAVDEHSLSMVSLTEDGRNVAEPVQFSPSPQPRAQERNLFPGTSKAVSYLNEVPAGATPQDLRTVGQLTWTVMPARTKYRLRFGVLRAGRMIQVPYPPQNLRAFDSEGRATPVRWFPQMQIRPQSPMDSSIQVFESNRLITAYHLGPQPGATAPFYRRPFLYPVIGPDEVPLTEFGKPHDPTGSHAHHYSLWIAHANVAGRDFWSERGGLIASEAIELLEDGPLFCRIVQQTRWMDGSQVLLKERRELTFHQLLGDSRLVDVDLQFSPAGTNAVSFGTTSFGFLAVRVAQAMSVFDGGGEIVNANGQRNEQQAHLQRAAWIDQSGPIAQDRWNGIALFDHPVNPNHPTTWHCRNDGWVGAAFNATSPSTLLAGAVLHLRYRVDLHRGNAREGQVAERYAEYAAPIQVHIGVPIIDPP